MLSCHEECPLQIVCQHCPSPCPLLPTLQPHFPTPRFPPSLPPSQIDHSRLASHGFFFNLGAVLLKLCQPFVDAAGSKLDRIDASYVLGTAGRISFG